jgi:hypothetical protein
MEQRGIKTEKGDFNREVKADNATMSKNLNNVIEEHEALQDWMQGVKRQQQAKIDQLQDELEKKNAELKKRTEQEKMNSERDKARVIAQDQAHDRAFRPREREPSTPKPPTPESKQATARATPQQQSLGKIGAEMGEIKIWYIKQSQALDAVKAQHAEHAQGMSRTLKRMDNIKRDFGEIEGKENRIKQLQQERQKLGMLQGKEKKAIDGQVESLRRANGQAERYFKTEYGVSREEAPAKLQELQAHVKETEKKIQTLPGAAKVRAQEDLLALKEMEYKQLKIQADMRPETERMKIEAAEKEHVNREVTPKIGDTSRQKAEIKLNNISPTEYQKLKKEMPSDIRKGIEDREKTGKDTPRYAKGDTRETQTRLFTRS